MVILKSLCWASCPFWLGALTDSTPKNCTVFAAQSSSSQIHSWGAAEQPLTPDQSGNRRHRGLDGPGAGLAQWIRKGGVGFPWEQIHLHLSQAQPRTFSAFLQGRETALT